MVETAFQRGNRLMREGSVDEAILAYQEAISENPNFYSIYQNLAEALVKRNRIEEAISTYKKAIELDSSSLAYYDLGELLIQQGREQEADSLYQEKVSIQTESPAGYNYLRSFFDPDETIEGDEDPWAIPHKLADSLREKGYLQEAVAAYYRAIALNPSYLDSYEKLAETLLQQGYIEQAIFYYRKAINLQPNEEHLHKRLSEIKHNKHKRDVLQKSTNNHGIQTQKSIDKSRAEFLSKAEENLDFNEIDIDILRNSSIDDLFVDRIESLLHQKVFAETKSQNEESIDERLIRCIAELYAEVRYLRSYILSSDKEIDPLSKPMTDPEKFHQKAHRVVPIQVDLRHRIAGNGWHKPDKEGRWTGPNTLSSLAIPYPSPRRYRFEMLVLSEAAPGLLDTLKIYINDIPLSDINKSCKSEFSKFPILIWAEIDIPNIETPQFTSIEILLNRTVASKNTSEEEEEATHVGIKVSSITLIPEEAD